MSDTPSPKRILITGASSGLGTALALAYAAPGVELFLGGRNLARLQQVAQHCEEKGALAKPHAVDVTDRAAMATWISSLSSQTPLDLVIANAGISGGTAGGPEGRAQIDAMIETNIHGVLNTLDPALPAMEKAGRGQCAIISSVAGFRGFPGSPTYCATKAAVKVYGEGLRPMLLPKGIYLNVVCPGYVKTPMTDVNDFNMPFIIDSDKAARIIQRGLAKNKARIAFPFPLYMIVWWLTNLPAWLTDRLLNRLPKKKPLSKS